MMAEYEGFAYPPEANANFAFVLSGLSKISDKAVYLLPCCVLSSSNKNEQIIVRQLIAQNWLEAVISLPDKMFESTSIPTCILVFNKKKQTQYIEMINLREQGEEVEREQKGQFGGNSHTLFRFKARLACPKLAATLEHWKSAVLAAGYPRLARKIPIL